MEIPPIMRSYRNYKSLDAKKGSLTTHDVTVRVSETIRIYQAAPDELKSGNARSTRWKDGKACSNIIGCIRLECSLKYYKRIRNVEKNRVSTPLSV